MKLCLLSLLLSLFLLSCQGGNAVSGKQYTGYWYETPYTFDFLDNQRFVLTYNGHYSVGETRGEYAIKGDSLYVFNVDNETIIPHGVLSEVYIIDSLDDCLIDPYMKFDYCARDEHGSRFRSIEYPQLDNQSHADAIFIDSIVLFGIDSLLSMSKDSFASDTAIYLKQYYSVGKTFDRIKSVKGSIIHVVAEPHPNIHWDQQYVLIDKINWNRKQNLFVEMKMYPDPWDKSILLIYGFENGKYLLRKR